MEKGKYRGIGGIGAVTQLDLSKVDYINLENKLLEKNIFISEFNIKLFHNKEQGFAYKEKSFLDQTNSPFKLAVKFTILYYWYKTTTHKIFNSG